jgi:hypothetical protein
MASRVMARFKIAMSGYDGDSSRAIGSIGKSQLRSRCQRTCNSSRAAGNSPYGSVLKSAWHAPLAHGKILANERGAPMTIVRQLPKLTDLDETELRAFYASCGLSALTIDNAIEARRKPLAEEEASALASKRKRGRHAIKPVKTVPTALRPARARWGRLGNSHYDDGHLNDLSSRS